MIIPTSGSPPRRRPRPGGRHARGGDTAREVTDSGRAGAGASAGSGLACPLVHASLDGGRSGEGLPLAEAHLTDRLRIGILLQAAALLSHLARAGWRVVDWREARATAEGLLVAPAAVVGRSPTGAQEVLAELIAVLFAVRGPVPGRGAARRAARALAGRWGQGLAAVPADRCVGEILEEAPFLWEPPLTLARRALAAEHRSTDGPRLWVAGPADFRSRLLSRAGDLGSLEELLAGGAARELWRGEEWSDPGVLLAQGRYRAAAAAWEDRPPRTTAQRLELARCLFALGRFSRSLGALAGERSAAAACLRLKCQCQLGALGPARITLRRLAAGPLAPAEVIEVAEVAARVLANSGDPERAGSWVRRALAAAGRGPLAARAALVAAEAAWDGGDLGEMAQRLEAARPALSDSALAWRWHQAQGLLAMKEADGARAVACLTRALASRRTLFRHEAGGLWNDLGLCRAQNEDLAGAERAFRHAARLFGGCEGPRCTTLGLHNLAEVRIRRGQLAGVREILDRAAAENRRAGNQRGLAQDAELAARLELACGRPAAALEICCGTLADLARRGVDWHRQELHAVAARALGWLGRPREAADHLALTDREVSAGLFEPEERPALWAHAGQTGPARSEAAGTRWAGLWEAALAGSPPPAAAWQALDVLEPYRAARLVLDLEQAAPGVAPPERRGRAAADLGAAGAGALAERLEGGEAARWRALATYLAQLSQPAGDRAALGALFAGAGHGRVELSWSDGNGERLALVDGPGGERELSAETGGGVLTLRAREIDPALGALFALAVRDLSPGTAQRASPAAAAPAPTGTGLVGDSPALRQALARAALYAAGDLTVLIQGESGTGKELVARMIHRASPRSRAQLVPVNCAALSETLILSDLFGHARGAFTGADRDRAGVFEAAQGGTVFLDEIGDLPATAQGMLLRVLQEREVRRLGESLPRRVDVRVVAATHRDLARLAAEGTFRLDLFYRLSVGRIELPALRERGRDVLGLAEHFLARLAARGGTAPPRLSRAAEAALCAHSWPGNVRELENVLAAAAALAGGGTIGTEHLDLPKAAAATTGASAYHQEVDALRRRLVAEAIAACGGNRAEAARRLGLSRQALSYLVRQLGLI